MTLPESPFRADLLAGARILITGGGTGLGRAMAERFVGLGAHLCICGRRSEPLAETAEALGPDRVAWRSCDIRDAEAVAEMVAAFEETAPLTGLVNNAAGNFIARTETLSPRAISAVVDIVLKGSAAVTLACGQRWLARGQAARVLSIVTSYAWTGSAYVVPSAMAKAGVLAMTRSLAVEWGGRGIALNAIAPGPFPTPGAWERLVPRPDLAETFETRNPLGRPGRPEELADLAAFMMASAAGYMNGEVVTLDGGEWLKGAGQFNFLDDLTAEDWETMRPKKG